jgi:hypothetical protein
MQLFHLATSLLLSSQWLRIASESRSVKSNLAEAFSDRPGPMEEPEPAQWRINYNTRLTSGEQPLLARPSREYLLFASGHFVGSISLTLSNATIREFVAAP